MKVAILTISDKGSRGEREDLSGPAIAECLASLEHEIIWKGVVPDEMEQIEQTLCKLSDEQGADLILTTGGTGLSPRDVTPEATMHVADREVPGISEALRAQTAAKARNAMLSRGVSVTRGHTLIINFPGSPKAVRECMEIVLPVLNHAVSVLKGTVSECAAR